MRLDGKIMMNNLLQTYTREAAAKRKDYFIIHIFYCYKCKFNKA